MMTKSDADGQNTSRYRISKKKQTQPIYEMVPCYEEAVILGDSLAESILDFRLLRKHNVVAKRNRCIDSIQGDLLFAISMQLPKTDTDAAECFATDGSLYKFHSSVEKRCHAAQWRGAQVS